SLVASLDTEHGIIAQFVAPEPDAAIRDVVYDLAHVSADWLGKRVLFVDGTNMRMGGTSSTRREPLLNTSDDLASAAGSITRVVGLELYQMTFPSWRGAMELAPSVRRIPE